MSTRYHVLPRACIGSIAECHVCPFSRQPHDTYNLDKDPSVVLNVIDDIMAKKPQINGSRHTQDHNAVPAAILVATTNGSRRPGEPKGQDHSAACSIVPVATPRCTNLLASIIRCKQLHHLSTTPYPIAWTPVPAYTTRNICHYTRHAQHCGTSKMCHTTRQLLHGVVEPLLGRTYYALGM
jgi:hypothetical protein